MTARAKILNTITAKLMFCILLTPALTLTAQKNYRLFIYSTDRDQDFIQNQLALQTLFDGKNECEVYINKLTGVLRAKGFITASIDSIEFDSASARMVLYFGQAYKWTVLNTDRMDPEILRSVGWNEKQFDGKPVDYEVVQKWQNRILEYLENNGHPFARIFLDSLQLRGDSVSAYLMAEKGPLYKIDSIRIFGDARISRYFIQRYLEIPDGSIYSKEKLGRIQNKILELPYLQEEKPSDMTLLGTGSVLNLYLKPKKASQVNALIGFLPNNDQLSSKKILITGEANIHLRNALGAGETIGLNWQQIQVKSPRLHILYQHPFVFNSPLGLDFAFDMFKKDSTFLNINLQFGARYFLSNNQTGKLFIQKFQTLISQGGINSAFIIQTRRLPDVADVGSFQVGVDYETNRTDYRLNPRKGYETRLIVSAGTKKIRKNNEILELKDPNDPSFDFERLYDTIKLKSYQFRALGSAGKYFPVGRQGTLKTALSAGVFHSDNIFRNELFQIGGYKLLRGFDEESQYVSQYAVATLEYRYLAGQNSYFFVFTDGGWARNTSKQSRFSHTYLGTGLGMAFETGAGIFNLAWAVGKREDTPFNLRQSKIHIGFVNYF